VDVAVVVFAVVDASAAANGPRKGATFPAVAIVSIGNEANILPALPPPPLLAALRVL
jgi:hypothetical protein